MNVKTWGRFVPEYRKILTEVAESRGHEVVTRTVAVILMMGYPHNISEVQTVFRGNRGGFVVVLMPVIGRSDVRRSFFKAGAHDVVNAPYGDEIHKMFAEIEVRMAEIFGGRM